MNTNDLSIGMMMAERKSSHYSLFANILSKNISNDDDKKKDGLDPTSSIVTYKLQS